jgi:signal transduction histidine kinase/HD-like signal output (HDOD) protein
MSASGLQRRKIEVLLDEVDQLPTLPGVAHRLLTLLTSDHPNRREIQFVIEADAALSARAVRLALESGRPAESVTSVEKILESLPMDVLAANFLSVETFSDETLGELPVHRLWRHILASGMASQSIAARLGTVKPEDALLAGILHDIGFIALAQVMPKAYGQMLARADSGGSDLLEAERALLGVDHAIVGKRLAQRWGFSQALQNAIWLHHQVQVPAANHAGTGALAQIVSLADIIVRQEGFSYLKSDQVREGAVIAAERLGLSGAGVAQIGHQVAQVFNVNALPAGIEGSPSLGDLSKAVSAASVRLGRLYRAEHARTQESEAQAHRADLLVRLNGRLAACHMVREVLQTVARAAQEALGVGVVVPYFVGRDGDYVEGVRSMADGDVQEHFLYPVSKRDGLDALAPDEEGLTLAAGTVVRAERIESWLFERQGAQLGSGPFHTIPMVVEQRKVGGLVFSVRDASRNLTSLETTDLAALASMAGIALKRVQAETDLVSLSEELAEVNRELQAAQDQHLREQNVASMGEMAAGAAHEINNPLAIISGRAQQLAADEPVAARREVLKTIIQQAGRISDIITELRQFARPPAPQFQSVDPVGLAQQVAAQFGQQAAVSSAKIGVEATQPAPVIRVDPGQVAEALREVVQNAAEACSNGHGGNVRIAVVSALAEQAVRFVVSDDGPGMAPAVRARAFDPFFCGQEAGRHRGLGLPKAFRAVQANGGQMALESTPGKGTTVRITFPVSQENERTIMTNG